MVPEGLAAYQCLEQKLLGQRAQAKHAHWQNGVRAWWCCPLPEQTNAWKRCSVQMPGFVPTFNARRSPRLTDVHRVSTKRAQLCTLTMGEGFSQPTFMINHLSWDKLGLKWVLPSLLSCSVPDITPDITGTQQTGFSRKLRGTAWQRYPERAVGSTTNDGCWDTAFFDSKYKIMTFIHTNCK